MKVLQINSVCGVGSTGRIATDLHNELKARGHESYIAYGRDDAKNCDNTIRVGSKLDNYVHVLFTRIIDNHGFSSRQATYKFIEEIENINPDVIHLHNIHGYYINFEILFDFLKKYNKPVVWTLHDCWAFTGHCAYFDFVGCDKWKTQCDKCPQKKVYPQSYCFDNSRKNFIKKKKIFTGVPNLTIVTPSKWLAGLVKESFLKDYSVETINNGIDLSIFKPKKSGFRENYGLINKKIILGVASPWSERKGFQYFIDLSLKLTSEYMIVLVGLNKKQIQNLPNNIIGISKTNNREELAQIYSAADIFLNPTLEDNYPTVNLEALACGIPVVTFNTGGSGEEILEINGKIIDNNEKEDIKEIFSSIKDVLLHRKNVGNYEKFSISNMVNNYLKIYYNTLGE